MQTCSNCFYSRPCSDEAVACRRYPPTIIKVEGNTITSNFPLVKNEAWCGEWAKQVNGKDAHPMRSYVPTPKQRSRT